MFISRYQLILYPERPDHIVDENLLVHILQQAGFIGDSETDYRYQTGDKFLSNICFLGCSPDIELQPQTDKAYTYIEIPKATDFIGFISGSNVKLPRCPECKKELIDLPDLLRSIQLPKNKLTHQINCQYCQTAINLFKLNWRKSACLFRSCIIVANIYEAEAVPDVQLLSTLEVGTGLVWKYSYVTTNLDD